MLPHMVFVLDEGDGRLVAVDHMLEEQRAVLDEVARVAVCFGPLADDGRRHVVELARQSVCLKEAAEIVPQARVVIPQCRLELVGCAIPSPASIVCGGVDEVVCICLGVSLYAAQRCVEKGVQIDPRSLDPCRFCVPGWTWRKTPSPCLG